MLHFNERSLPWPKLVVLDWDSTLIDSQEEFVKTVNQVFESMGKRTISLQEAIQKPRLSIRDYFRQIFGSQELPRAESLFVHYSSHSKPKAFPKAASLLQWLKDQEIPMAILSNKAGDLLRNEVQDLNWSSYFTMIVGSHDTPEDKPSPKPLLYIIEEMAKRLPSLNLKANYEVWFVGDSMVDMLCAAGAGCLPVSVGDQADEFSDFKVSAKDCQGLLDLLQEIARKNRHKKNTLGTFEN